MKGKNSKRAVSIGTKTLISHVTLCIVVVTLACVLSYALTSQYMRQTRIQDLMEGGTHRRARRREPDGGIMPNGARCACTRS